MKVAAIITSINQGSALPRAIKSLSKQSRQPDKIIVCSTENIPEEVLNKYNAELINLPQNSSHDDGFYKGVLSVVNDYDVICLLNAQDYYYNNKIQDSLDILRKYPFVGIVYSDFDVFGPNQDSVSSIKCHAYNEPMLHGRIIPENCIIRSSLISRYAQDVFSGNGIMIQAKNEFVAYSIPKSSWCQTLPRIKNERS